MVEIAVDLAQGPDECDGLAPALLVDSKSLDGTALYLLLELLDPAAAHAYRGTLDREAQELEPVTTVKVLNLFGIELHIHGTKLVTEHGHGLLIVLADIEHVVRIADIIALHLAQLVVDITEQHISQPRGHRAALLQRLVLALQVTVRIKVQVRMVVLAQHVDQSALAMALLHLVKGGFDKADRH